MESPVVAEVKGKGCKKSSEEDLALYKWILGVFWSYSEPRGAVETFRALCSLSISYSIFCQITPKEHWARLQWKNAFSTYLFATKSKRAQQYIAIKLQAGEAGHPSAQLLGTKDTCSIATHYVFAPFHITALGLPGERSLMLCHLLLVQATHILQLSI